MAHASFVARAAGFISGRLVARLLARGQDKPERTQAQPARPAAVRALR
ncbi:hypothetical protein [Azohydromonas caseinilytica]|uniref:Uncharacterized protein n=1 Tax=Azohydromonas caseinilytica TaxID=2728836 RepID=A0A848FFP6_9BURK|nr:hypothetical protein [Azohydromonas caseinilytica]NML18194.1 hypothetical protein [Azohydromonas caseinilytica]